MESLSLKQYIDHDCVLDISGALVRKIHKEDMEKRHFLCSQEKQNKSSHFLKTKILKKTETMLRNGCGQKVRKINCFCDTNLQFSANGKQIHLFKEFHTAKK